jgi:hypothetical protein
LKYCKRGKKLKNIKPNLKQLLKQQTVLILLLGILFSIIFIPSLVSGRTEPKSVKSYLYAKGKGLIIYGYNWYPPFPGEPFFVGSDEAEPPILAMLGEPEWSSKLTESKLHFIGKSSSPMEDSVRPDPPFNLPAELTKYWLYEMTGTGSLRATWVKDNQENKLEIMIRDKDQEILGVWIGPPGTCDWGFFAAGGPNPQILSSMSYKFDGILNDEYIEGYITVCAWPDIMMANLWIDDGEEGAFVNLVWVNPDSFTTHYWLAYWLGEEIGIPEFGYDEGEDPLATWVPPAEKFKLRIRTN